MSPKLSWNLGAALDIGDDNVAKRIAEVSGLGARKLGFELTYISSEEGS